MPSSDEIREVQRAAWAALSPGWEKWDSVIMDQLGPVGATHTDEQSRPPGLSTRELGGRFGDVGEEHVSEPAIATEAVLAPPDPDAPGMFRCAARGYVSALYEAAGLRHVAEWHVDVELVTRSPAQYWEMISEHVSLAVAPLQQVDQPARERIAKAVIAKASIYEAAGKVRIPGVARCPGPPA